MSRRRQRRPVSHDAPPVPASAPAATPNTSTWPRPCSTPLLRRRSRTRPSQPALPPRPHTTEPAQDPTPTPFVPVRVLDFVTVPAARLGSPHQALGPVDQALRPPSYDLSSSSPRAPHAWDPDATDRLLDAEYSSVCSTSSEASIVQRPENVFLIEDDSHIDRLRHIVGAAKKSATPETVRPDLTSEAEVCVVHRIDDHLSDASSTQLSASQSSMLSTAATSRQPVAASSAASTAGLSQSPSICSDPPSVLVPVQRTSPVSPTRRACLLPKKAPSPVKYTFRPPVQPPHALKDRQEGYVKGTAVVPRMLHERVMCVPRETSNVSRASGSIENAPSLDAVKGAVESIDPRVVLGMATPPSLGLSPVGIFRRAAFKRDSDESSRSTSTEYYEDEYTKFIGRKTISPLRLRPLKIVPAETMAGKSVFTARTHCRSNSTVSVATSDDEYNPAVSRFSRV